MLTMTAPTWTMHGGLPGLGHGHAGLRELFEHIGPIEVADRRWWTDIRPQRCWSRWAVRGGDCAPTRRLFTRS